MPDQQSGVTTMADLDELALSMPQTTKELSDDGRASYYAASCTASIAVADPTRSIPIPVSGSTTC